MDPAIIFCTTCKDRLQHLKRTLPRNIADNENYPNCKFLVLDYCSTEDVTTYLQGNHRDSLGSGRLVTYRFVGPIPQVSLAAPPEGRKVSFRMAHAKNMAHRLGILEGADVLVNLDADNFTGVGFARYVADCFSASPEVVLWSRWNLPNSDKLHIPKGCSGRIAVSKNSFLLAGGYDERYRAWGPDDKDFNYRLRRLGRPAQEIDPCYLGAILHNDKMRFREYPDAAILSRDYHSHRASILEIEGSGSTVVNDGQFGRGVVYRNFDPSTLRELAAIPTRIFGIGMHKTATTSLHAALRIMGLSSAHWKSVRWAKSIWEEMTEQGRSQTLEGHYALSDLPIPLLYESLDRAYPGSKFILTTRGEEEWIRSVERHWSQANGFLDTWRKEGSFSHEIHRELYGQPEFDREVFLARFRRHNAAVREYFRDRPEDLLVMDMGSQAGWKELCGFLKLPIPAGEYPRKYVTET